MGRGGLAEIFRKTPEQIAEEQESEKRLRKNVGALNQLTSSGISYFNFHYYNFNIKGGCIGHEEVSESAPEHWIAYVARGETRFDDKDKKIIIPKAVFYKDDRRVEMLPRDSSLALSLSSKHLQEGAWHLFYIAGYIRVLGGMEGFNLHSSLYVMSGMDNLGKLCNVVQESVRKRAREGFARNPEPLDVAEKMPWPVAGKKDPVTGEEYVELDLLFGGGFAPTPFPNAEQLYEAASLLEKTCA